MRPTALLVTVTGRDRPGVTAVTFAALAAHDVDVRDVVQTVNGPRASLAILVDLRGDPAALRHSVSSTAQAFGVDSHVIATGEDVHVVNSGRQPRSRAGRNRAIVVGTQLRAGALGDVAKRVSDIGCSIESMWKESAGALTGVQMSVAGDSARVRSALMASAGETGLDIAVGRPGPRTRARRLLVLDADAVFPEDAGAVLAEDAGGGVRRFLAAARDAGCGVGAVGGPNRIASGLGSGLGLDTCSTAAADDAVRDMADETGVALSRVVAVGDSRASAELLAAAGTAIAVDAAAARRAATDATGYLDSVLYILGRI